MTFDNKAIWHDGAEECEDDREEDDILPSEELHCMVALVIYTSMRKRTDKHVWNQLPQPSLE
jgi:hypothetical protein